MDFRTDLPLARTAVNDGVDAAAPGEFSPIEIGPISVWPPVVLAPMAGVTDVPVPPALPGSLGVLGPRGPRPDPRARALRQPDDHRPRAWSRATARPSSSPNSAPTRTPRSIQLYGTDPIYLGQGGRAAGRDRARRSHRHELRLPGGQGHQARRRRGAPLSPTAVPPHRPSRRPGRTGSGARHGEVPHGHRRRPPHPHRHRSHRRRRRCIGRRPPRTDRRAALLRRGPLGRDRRAEGRSDHHPGPGQRRHLGAPRCTPHAARHTGADGVVIGRGCLGRPWLFRDLARVFEGGEVGPVPTMAEAGTVHADARPS